MKIKQIKDFCRADFPGKTVIFNPKTYRSIILNDSAALIWDFCQKPRTLSQISKFLNTKYEINLPKARQDAQRFIRQLEKRKLVNCRG